MARIRSFRINVTDAPSSFTVPNLNRPGFGKKLWIRNTSALISVRFAFPGDNANDYITVGPGESTPVFSGLIGGESVTTDGVGGAATVEVLIWEE